MKNLGVTLQIIRIRKNQVTIITCDSFHPFSFKKINLEEETTLQDMRNIGEETSYVLEKDFVSSIIDRISQEHNNLLLSRREKLGKGNFFTGGMKPPQVVKFC